MDVDPALCSIETGVAVPLATVGKERKFAISLKNTSSDKMTKSVPLQVVLRSSNGREIPVTISTEDGPSKPILTFTPDTTGEHELSIMVTGTHIHSSPYRMWVRQERDLSTVGGAQLHFNVRNRTYDVAVHHNGDVYCTNNDRGFVQVFDRNGTQKIGIGSPGNGDGQFSAPWGLTIVDDILYVTDKSNHKVQKFTTTGEYIGQFGSKGSGDGQFDNPTAITHDGRGHVIVADEYNNRIQIFQLDGTHVRSINCGDNMYGVAVDNDGNIHVPLFNNHIVQVYSFKGQILNSYDNPSGRFGYPRGVFIDDNGYRYVTSQHSTHYDEFLKYYLHILNPQGNQVKIIPTINPFGVTLDAEGYIYVAECGNSHVSKY